MEDRYIFICPKCHFLAIAIDVANENKQCPKCKSIMRNTNITKETWDESSKEEKLALINKLTNTLSEQNYFNSESSIIIELNNIKNSIDIMDNDINNVTNAIIAAGRIINTIKNIFMFYFVLTFLGLFIMWVNAVN